MEDIVAEYLRQDSAVTGEVGDVFDMISYEYKDNKIIAKRTDPHGFWVVSMGRGQIPRVLEGAFTTPHYAMNAIQKFLASKETIKEV